MKKWIKISFSVFLIPVVLLSTSGFTLIHHHCESCDQEELHFSFLEKDFHYECTHNHHSETTESCSHKSNSEDSNCLINNKSDNGKESCCSNNFEFFRLDIPVTNEVDDDNSFLANNIEFVFPIIITYNDNNFSQSDFQRLELWRYHSLLPTKTSIILLNCVNIC